MTMQQWAEKYLTDNGLWPQEATAVVGAVKADRANESMEQRWNDGTEGYPKPLLDVLQMALRAEAVRWIDANQPQHFARTMFT